MQTWQEARADYLDVAADNVEAAVVALRRLEGMFITDNERAQIATTIDQLGVKNTNLRSEADRLRKEVGLVASK